MTNKTLRTSVSQPVQSSSAMHRLIPIFLIQFLLPGETRAQNMVVNHSFEATNPSAIVVPCEFMQYSQYFGQNTADWSGFSDGTPDLLRSGNDCTWLPQAHNGEQCLGLITYLPTMWASARTITSMCKAAFQRR